MAKLDTQGCQGTLKTLKGYCGQKNLEKYVENGQIFVFWRFFKVFQF